MSRVLAVASSGGHWEQIRLLAPALDGHDVTWLGTHDGLPDCNAGTPLRALACAAVLAGRIVRERPDAVISTGALPGLIALALGRLAGARTLWIDSVANAERMSRSGRLARRVADLRLSQWPEVARAEGAAFAGSVL